MGWENVWDDLLNGFFGGGDANMPTNTPGLMDWAMGQVLREAKGPPGVISALQYALMIWGAKDDVIDDADWPDATADPEHCLRRGAASEGQQMAAESGGGRDDSSTRSARGGIADTIGYGQSAANDDAAIPHRTFGQIDQAAGMAGTGGLDGDNPRQLQRLGRWGESIPAATPDVADAGSPTGAKQNLLGTPDQPAVRPGEFDFMKPEKAYIPRRENEIDTSSRLPFPPGATVGADGILEVHVRGQKPYRGGRSVSDAPPPPTTYLPVSALPGATPGYERQEVAPPNPGPATDARSPNASDDFWSRGGATHVFGGATAVLGAVIILSNPAGWILGLTGALMLAGGLAATVSSDVQLAASYAGMTTPEQAESTTRGISAVLGVSSPGGLLGGVAGTVFNGDEEGFEQGAFWGGMGEGAMSLGLGAARWGNRALRMRRLAAASRRAEEELAGPLNFPRTRGTVHQINVTDAQLRQLASAADHPIIWIAGDEAYFTAHTEVMAQDPTVWWAPAWAGARGTVGYRNAMQALPMPTPTGPAPEMFGLQYHHFSYPRSAYPAQVYDAQNLFVMFPGTHDQIHAAFGGTRAMTWGGIQGAETSIRDMFTFWIGR